MWKFLREYIKTPDTIGAVAPSSKHLAAAMTAWIDFDKAKCIVEYGAGTGIFTREVCKKKRPGTVYIVIEQNDRFYSMLQKQFHEVPGVVLIHGDAGNVCRFLKKQGFSHADHIISGLPFTSLPEPVSSRILSQTQKAVGAKGVFTAFQYTLLRRQFLEEYFNIRKIVRIWRNLPPAYVLNMKLKCRKADINVTRNGPQDANSNNINCCREGI